MTMLKLLLALLAAALAAVGVVNSGGSQSGDDTVISDPGSDGSDSGTVDRGDDTTPDTTTPPPNRTARLNWYAPLAREDGEPLLVGEITGYRVRIERQGSSAIQLQSVSASSTATTINLTNAGTYYFSIAAVDDSGIYSSYSARVSATFN